MKRRFRKVVSVFLLTDLARNTVITLVGGHQDSSLLGILYLERRGGDEVSSTGWLLFT